MLGGYQIIDLRKVGLEMKQTQQSFSNAEVLDQLRNLRALIQKGHDYTKPLSNSQKPILIRYRDAKNGEKAEVCGYADIISTNASLTYEIKTKNLQIEVVFEEKTNDDGVKYYDIKTAKYYYNENENVEGKLIVNDEANFKEDVDMDKDLNVDGDLTVTGAINGEQNPSVKPIYYHGIDMYDTTNHNAIQCHILSNDSAPINTLDKFRAWAESINGRVIIQTNGGVKIGASWFVIYCIVKTEYNTYDIAYIDPSTGYSGVSNVTLEDYISVVQDAVNKIN